MMSSRNASARRMAAILCMLCAALALAVAMAAPSRAVAQDAIADPTSDAIAVDLDDGIYLVDVSLEGGSGRASITSPTQLRIDGGKGVLTVEWSSPNYDYMLVASKRYLPTNDEGNSTFEIPLLALDEPFDVVGDTTAMSEPHEIEYQITCPSASIQAVSEDAGKTALPLPVKVCCAVAMGAAVVLLVRRRASGRDCCQ